MLQTCTTELSELCERLSRELSIPRLEKDGKTILKGDNYSVSHKIESDKVERITYSDKAGWFSVSVNDLLVYDVKNRFLEGRLNTLGRTALGNIVAAYIENLIVTNNISKRELKLPNRELVVKLKYSDLDSVYELLKSHI